MSRTVKSLLDERTTLYHTCSVYRHIAMDLEKFTFGVDHKQIYNEDGSVVPKEIIDSVVDTIRAQFIMPLTSKIEDLEGLEIPNDKTKKDSEEGSSTEGSKKKGQVGDQGESDTKNSRASQPGHRKLQVRGS